MIDLILALLGVLAESDDAIESMIGSASDPGG